MSDLCRSFGISRNTGYELLKRFEKYGFDGVRDRSRAPRSHPNKTPSAIAEKIIEVRLDRPTWGVKKILAWLRRRDPESPWPARSTAERILGDANLLQHRRRKRRPGRVARVVPVINEPNDLWCQDFKGWFRLGNGHRCDPHTLTDAKTRFALSCTALIAPQLEDVQRCLVLAFKKYGLPGGILSDNGPPFGSTSSPAGLTRLGVWLLRLGITPYFIDPGRPDQNGRLERFHSTLELETANPPRRTLRAQQMTYNRFLPDFNYERPHEALDMATPGDFYQPSTRAYPSKLPDWKYPDDFDVRLVRCCGTIKWRGERVRIGAAFISQSVGLEAVGDGVLRVHLGKLALGHFHEASRKLVAITR